MEEKVFLNAKNASVTSSKIVIANSTYATRNVGSVRVETIPRPKWPWIVLIIGLLFLLGAPALGVILVAIAAFVLWQVGPKSKLILLAGGGETCALISSDTGAVEELHQAIVEAISAR